MKIIKTVSSWRKIQKSGSLRNKTLGFVPTMGALHEGHLSLVQKAKKENDLAIVSIFVNPTQFNDKKDLRRYPKTLASDMVKLRKAGADLLLLPNFKTLYPDNYRYRVSENKESKVLCGKFRAGHFDGVLTIVMKLLNLANADRAYFGEKDYQQYTLIRGMAEAFFIKTKIIPCAIIREPDGLAMSSRNTLLSTKERTLAPRFRQILAAKETPGRIRQKLSKAGLKPEYVEERWGRRLAAVKLGKTRLIDNVKL